MLLGAEVPGGTLMTKGSPLAKHCATAAELQAQLAAARGLSPYLIYRDESDQQQIVILHAAGERVTIGRAIGNQVSLMWDMQISRVHAELERLAGEWTLSDDGLSSNGTYVNGLRIRGRRRLHDGDLVMVGTTVIAFCQPSEAESRARTTLLPPDLGALPRLSDQQRAVLIELARPYKDSTGFAIPATNREIAERLTLSIDGVKSALRVLFEKFSVRDLPQNEKRAQLVERAFQAGVISEYDLVDR